MRTSSKGHSFRMRDQLLEQLVKPTSLIWLLLVHLGTTLKYYNEGGFKAEDKN